MNKGLEFMRETREYPAIRKAVQAENIEAERHRTDLFNSFYWLSVGMADFCNDLPISHLYRLPSFDIIENWVDH